MTPRIEGLADPQGKDDGLTIGSLFTGTGALCELAVAPLLGGRVVWHCENDPAASTVLAYRCPGTPNLGDITAVDWSGVEPVEVLAGGFPCQDISSAGRRAGIEGERSGLWSYFADAIRILRPHLVLVENVSALVVRGLDRVLADLAAVGFDAEWTVVPASDVGAPHRRERVFVAAADSTSQGGGWVQPEHVGLHRGAEVQPGQAEPGRRDRPAADPSRIQVGEQPVAEPRGSREAKPGLDHASATDANGDGREGKSERNGTPRLGEARHERRRVDADGCFLGWGPYAAAVERWERRVRRVAPSPTVVGKRGGQQLNPVFVEWMMGWPEGHVTAVPALSRNAMLRLCGNGVVPQQASAAFEHLLPLLLSSERRAAS